MIIVPYCGFFREVKAIHFKQESKKPKILMFIIVVELIAVIASCLCIFDIRGHNIEVRAFWKVCTNTVEKASNFVNQLSNTIVKTYNESIAEEMYEYGWITEKTEYRTGADMSYSSAGTLEKDKLVRRTGITHNGWSRIVIEGEEYYIPKGRVSTDTPAGLPIAAGIKGEYQKYALSLLPDFGWDDSQLEPLIYLWNKESGWNPRAHNRSSGAHGIPQALPGRKMASEGSDYYTNPEPQIRWGLKYIARRYGSPSSAWGHFRSKGWY